jgi:hypothetical protein
MTMKHIASSVKNKYEILGVIGEGIELFLLINFIHYLIKINRFIWCGAQGSKKSMKNIFIDNKKNLFFSN